MEMPEYEINFTKSIVEKLESKEYLNYFEPTLDEFLDKIINSALLWEYLKYESLRDDKTKSFLDRLLYEIINPARKIAFQYFRSSHYIKEEP